MKYISGLFVLFVSINSFAGEYVLTDKDLTSITAAANRQHQIYNICDDNKVARSEVRIDQTLTVIEGVNIHAFGQTYYYCNGSDEKIEDEYCEFIKDGKDSEWHAEYCDH